MYFPWFHLNLQNYFGFHVRYCLVFDGLCSNGTLDLSPQKIQYFFKKIFNFHVYVSVDNDIIKIKKEIEHVNSHILENMVK